MKLRLGASGFMIAAGLIHLVIAPLHWAHAPAHGLFFALSGIAEVAWGIAYWRKPLALMRYIGVVMAGGLITLWVITRLLPAPFGDEPGEIEAIGVALKLIEGLGLVALVALSVSGATSREAKISGWLEVGKFAAASLMVGGLTYQIAVITEPLFPGLGESSTPTVVASVVNPVNEAITSSLAVENTSSEISSGGSSIADDLQLVVAGFASPFVNGSEVPVAGDLMAQLTVTAGDERYGRNLELYLYHQTSSRPLTEATVQGIASMRFMDHGTFYPTALNLDDGYYILLLPFPMPGEWHLELEIVTPDTPGTIQLDITLFE
jgi:hypothetical protein